MIGRRGIVDLILAIQPEMNELLRLREEVLELRFKKHPPTPTVAELIEDLPITLRQMDDGTWSSTIRAGDTNTGVGGSTTDVECFKASVRHLAQLLGQEWSREDDE